MKKVIIAIISMLPMVLSAQWGLTPNQIMVKESIEPSLAVVCSAYKLQDSTGQRYGRNNRTEFSQGYVLGVVTDSGLFVSSLIVQPWLYDTDFNRYSHSHKPVLSKVSCRQIGDSIYKSMPVDIDSVTYPLLHVSVDSSINIPALALHTDTTYKNGWLLWCFASDTLGKAGTISTVAIMCSAELNDSVSTQRVMAPVESCMIRDSCALRKLIGAVWVVPCYPKAGMVQFRVAGMVVQDNTNWLLIPIHIDAEDNYVSSNEGERVDSELTPSPDQQQDQGKKNKKNRKNK